MARWLHCSRSADRRTARAIATSSWSASSAPWWRLPLSLRSARCWGRSEASAQFPHEPCQARRLERCLHAPQASIQGIIMPVDVKTATDRLMRFLSIEGVTGKLMVYLPGRVAMHNQPRIMVMTHMDTVPLCAGAKPKVKGRKIVNEAKTALGGDNRAGCGVLVTLAAELAKQQLDHPPITLLFCVREESGLWGARHVKTDELGSPAMAFNYDGGSASNVTIGAVGADRWQVEIFGRASHAGVAPERGISSTMILALALADVKAGGWFGKVVKGKSASARQGTSNVGPVTGG